jgi:25S rRNA (adenine2142-N1)-methyltransferase
MPSSSRNNKRQRPLAPAPLRSLKRARQVTTTFHRLSRLLVAAQANGDALEIARLTKQIEEAGGREAYQQASQVSTAVHSTSKWVMAHLVSNGWICGIPEASNDNKDITTKRPTRLLEVGAINTQLLEAATRSNGKLIVRAIDLQSSHADIEDADFLQLSLDEHGRYDVIVCSMVLNCVNTAEERGNMICRLYHFSVPEGLVFITLPKTCLQLSPYIDEIAFLQILETVGFQVVEQKSSPKLCFFVLRRMTAGSTVATEEVLKRWATVKALRRGKKYRKNDFSIILNEKSVRCDEL